MRARLLIALLCLLPQTEAASAGCSGCGCRGGPGYRGPSGRCVGWSDIGRTCGSPPTSRCAAEGPNAGADEAAELGVRALNAKPTRNQDSLGRGSR